MVDMHVSVVLVFSVLAVTSECETGTSQVEFSILDSNGEMDVWLGELSILINPVFLLSASSQQNPQFYLDSLSQLYDSSSLAAV